ncbi:hypothetical protein [Aeromonas media]|uniref:hypothetical protein n=1 Tax=Aeromonas TaxID=642 RepID=UPI001115F9AE|nr:hypothetical protein [Aeromonas media]
MAKEKYKLIPHDDKDILSFKILLGQTELEKFFLSLDDKSPKINNHGLGTLFKSTIRQFSTVDDIELIYYYHQYLSKQLTKKIKNYQHKSAAFKSTIQYLIEYSGRAKNHHVDVSILESIQGILDLLIGYSDEKVVLDDSMSEQTSGSENNAIDISSAMEVPARDIAARLINLANDVYRNKDCYSLSGTSTEFLAYIADILLIDTPQNITEQWLEVERKACHQPEGISDDDQALATATQISMDFGSYHNIVKIFLISTYFILQHIEELFPVGERSKTLSPDQFIYVTQIKRSFGEGSKQKLITVPTHYRDVTYKVWLYYWQHSQPKFQCSTSDDTEEPYVTAKEMIMALAEAFPNTAIALEDSSSDGLATRRNIISELYKYPSLVDHYFNHEG